MNCMLPFRTLYILYMLYSLYPQLLLGHKCTLHYSKGTAGWHSHWA